MPDYPLRLDGDMIVFENRGTMDAVVADASIEVINLHGDVYEKARVAAPGWDVHYLEQA